MFCLLRTLFFLSKKKKLFIRKSGFYFSHLLNIYLCYNSYNGGREGGRGNRLSRGAKMKFFVTFLFFVWEPRFVSIAMPPTLVTPLNSYKDKHNIAMRDTFFGLFNLRVCLIFCLEKGKEKMYFCHKFNEVHFHFILLQNTNKQWLLTRLIRFWAVFTFANS